SGMPGTMQSLAVGWWRSGASGGRLPVRNGLKEPKRRISGRGRRSDVERVGGRRRTGARASGGTADTTGAGRQARGSTVDGRPVGDRRKGDLGRQAASGRGRARGHGRTP